MGTEYLNGRIGHIVKKKNGNGRYGIELKEEDESPSTCELRDAPLLNMEKNLRYFENSTEGESCSSFFSTDFLSQCSECRYVVHCSRERMPASSLG